MAYVPPLFKNFGKSFKDLLEKKFDYNREVKVKTSTQSGVTFESAGRTNSKSNDYIGALKTTYKRGDFGTLELEVDTEGKAKYSAEADQLKKGVVVKISGDQQPSGGIDASLRREYLAVSGGVNVAPKGTTFDASGALGFDGLSVGGAVKVDTKTQLLTDYNAGAEYSQPDFTLTVKTADRADKVGASYIHNVNPDASVGASFTYNIASSQRLDTLLSLVTSYNVDRDTTVKAKFSSDATLSAALEQRLYNPRVKYGLAAEYNLKNQSATPERFGLAFTLGD